MNEADDIDATSEVGVVSPGYTSDAWGLGSADMQQDPESFAVSAPQSETATGGAVRRVHRIVRRDQRSVPRG